MLAATTKTDARITEPITTGWSCWTTDCTASAPIPGRPKTFSVTITPPSAVPRSMPSWVTAGVSALRSACR